MQTTASPLLHHEALDAGRTAPARGEGRTTDGARQQADVFAETFAAFLEVPTEARTTATGDAIKAPSRDPERDSEVSRHPAGTPLPAAEAPVADSPPTDRDAELAYAEMSGAAEIPHILLDTAAREAAQRPAAPAPSRPAVATTTAFAAPSEPAPAPPSQGPEAPVPAPTFQVPTRNAAPELREAAAANAPLRAPETLTSPVQRAPELATSPALPVHPVAEASLARGVPAPSLVAARTPAEPPQSVRAAEPVQPSVAAATAGAPAPAAQAVAPEVASQAAVASAAQPPAASARELRRWTFEPRASGPRGSEALDRDEARRSSGVRAIAEAQFAAEGRDARGAGNAGGSERAAERGITAGPSGSGERVSQSNDGRALAAFEAALVRASVAPAEGARAAAAPGTGTPQEVLPLHVEWLAARGGGSARIRLHPAELGELQLHVRTRGSVVEVRVLAREPEALRLVGEQRLALGEALAARDLRMEQFEVLPATSRDGHGSQGESSGHGREGALGDGRERGAFGDDRGLEHGGREQHSRSGGVLGAGPELASEPHSTALPRNDAAVDLHV